MSSHTQLHISHGLQAPSSVKREQEFNTLRPEIPPWLAWPLLPTHFDQSLVHHDQNPNPTTTFLQSTASPHMSATALLQKASQIGVTVSKTAPSSSTAMLRPHMQQQAHVPMASSSAVSGMVMQSREDTRTIFPHGLAPYGNKAAITASDYLEDGAANNTGYTVSSHFHDMMGSTSSNVHSASGFESSSSFDEAMRGMFNAPRDGNFEELVSKSTQPQISKSNKGTVAGVNDEMTRDFMGLRAFSQRDFFNISELDHLGSSSYGKQNHNQAPWLG